MKHLYSFKVNFPLLFLVTFLCISCSSQKDFITESDYSYTGKFKKYKTFHFTHLAENDSLYFKELIEETIVSKLDAQGYDLTDKKPDLLVTYKIFKDDFEMQGYDQPKMETWVYNDWGDHLIDDETEEPSYPKPAPAQHLAAEYDARGYVMYGGSLLITFYDTRRRKAVWQGYASGVFSSNYDSNERNVKLATAKIFREFRLLANGYVVKGGA